MTDEPDVVAPLPDAAATQAATAWHLRCVAPWAYGLRKGEGAALLNLALRRAHQDATSVAPSEASPE